MLFRYSNRSLCYIQLQNYSKAETDASKAINCDPLFVKAWLRRGICRIARKDIQPAYFDLLRVIYIILFLITRLMS